MRTALQLPRAGSAPPPQDASIAIVMSTATVRATIDDKALVQIARDAEALVVVAVIGGVVAAVRGADARVAQPKGAELRRGGCDVI